MKNTFTLAVAAIMLVLIAGCGSSKKSTTSSSSAAAPATTASSSSTATSSAGHGYAAGTGSSSSAASAVAVTAKHSKLGTVLAAGPKRLTVYLFEADTSSTSNCNGACASVWPPVTVSGAASAHGAAMTADLGTITRSDGTKQVTYKGHPLYYYAKDKDSGDAYGEGVKAFGAEWYVLAPSGNKIDKS